MRVAFLAVANPQYGLQKALGTYRFWSTFPQERSQVPASQQLQDDEFGMGLKADPDELDDVVVTELVHDERLQREVPLRHVRGQLRQGLDRHRLLHGIRRVPLEEALVDLAKRALAKSPGNNKFCLDLSWRNS